MSKHIAIVLTITGIVKVLNETQGERVLKPGDVIFDDDILFAFTESTISTKHGLHIQLKVGEQWEFENGQFIVSSNQEKAVNAVPDSLSSISFQTVESETDKTPFADEGFGPVYRVNQSGNSGHVLRIGEELQPHLLNTSTRGLSTDIGITLGDGFNSSFYLDDFISFKKAFYALLSGGRNPSLDELLRLDVQRIDQYNIGSVQGNIRRVVADNIEISTLDQLQEIADTAIEILNKIVKAAIENNATSETATIDELDRIGINNIDSSILIPFFSVLNKLNVVGTDVDTSAEIQGIIDAYNKILFAADGVDNNNAALSLNDFKALGIASINSPSDIEFMNDVLDLKINTDIIDVESIQIIADSYRAVLSAADGIDNSSNLALTDFENLELSHINSATKAQLLADIIDIKEQTEVDSYAKLQQIAAVVSHVIEVADTNTTSLSINEYLLIDIAGVNELNLALVFQAIQATLANGSQIDSLAELQNLVNTTIYLDINADTGRADNDQYTADTQINILNADTSGLWHYSTDGGSNWFVGSGNSFSVPTDMFFNSADIQVKAVNSTGSLRYAKLAALTTDNTSDDITLVLAQDSGLSNTDNITEDNQVNVLGLEALSNWSYSLDSGASWLLGSGASFNVAQNTTYINNAIQVRSVDLAGNEFSATMGPLTTDDLADTVSLVLNSDDGVSNSDNITSDTTILLLGLEGLTSWQYSLDAGGSWLVGVGSSFNLATDTSYSSDQIQVKTLDLSGNEHLEKMPEVVISALVSAIIDTDISTSLVSENAVNGTLVGITAFAVDSDAGDTVTYSLSDSASGRFSIDSTSGVVIIANAGLIDFESATFHNITIVATSTDGSTSSSTHTVNIGDNNVGTGGGGSTGDTDNAVGSITDSDATVNLVSENAANGTAVGITGLATDADGDVVTYSLSNNAGGRFSIDSNTGVITVANASLIDYETSTSHNITIVATSADGSTSNSTLAVDIGDNNNGAGGGGSTGDTDNAVGSITDSDATVNLVSENAANGTAVGITSLATDADGDVVTYSLSNNAGGRFSIDSNTGVITVANASLIDYETSTSHNITIVATSADGSTSNRTLAVDIGDNNNGAGGGGSTGDTDNAVGAITDSDVTVDLVSENAASGVAVGITGLATDADGDTVTYSLSDDAGGRFSIDSNTGVITVANASLLDYETSTSHNITIVATSADGSTSNSTLAIAVGDNNNGAGGGGSTGDTDNTVGAITDSDVTVDLVSENAANGVAVGITGLATDADGDIVTYSLSDDAGGRFSINSNTGVITVANASLLDYETNTSHNITIVATSADGSTSNSTLAIAVGDNNNGAGGGGSTGDTDNAVGSITDSDVTVDLVSENAASGVAVGITGLATDADGDIVTYSLSDDAGGRFSIDSNTGVISVANASLLDYETNTSHNITIVATSADGSTSNSTLAIAVGDNNNGAGGGGSTGDTDNAVGAITDSDGSLNFIAENAVNGALVGVVALANDIDAGDTVTYSLSDNANGRFVIDANSGIVTLLDAMQLDYETTTNHNISVLATSLDGSTSSTIINIVVGDINDAPVITATNTSVTEDISQVIGRLSDTDGSINIALSTASAINGVVTIELNGDITYTPNANYNGTDTVSITAVDNGGATSTDTILLTIVAVNDAPVAVDDLTEVIQLEVAATNYTGNASTTIKFEKGVSNHNDNKPEFHAIGTQGDYAMTWISLTGGGTYTGASMQHFNADGSLKGGIITIHSGYSLENSISSVGNNGDYYVTWSQDGSSGEQTGYTQLYHEDGSSEAAINLGTIRQGTIETKEIAGGVVYVWQVGGSSVYTRTIYEDGSSTGNMFLGGGASPNIAVLDNGDYVISWNPSTITTVLDRFDSAGNRIGSAQYISIYDNNEGAVVHSIGSNDEYIMLGSNNNKMTIARYDASNVQVAGSLEVISVLEATQSFNANLIELNDGSGVLVAVWGGVNGGLFSIDMKLINPDGSSATATVNISAGPAYLTDVISVGNSGEYVVSWLDAASGNYDVHVQKFNADGSTNGTELIFTGENAAVNESGGTLQAIGAEGAYTIAYSGKDSEGDSSIYKATVNKDGEVELIYESSGTGDFDIITAALDAGIEYVKVTYSTGSLEVDGVAYDSGSYIKAEDWSSVKLVGATGGDYDLVVEAISGYIGTVDEIISIDALANDTDVEGDTLTITKIEGQDVSGGQIITIESASFIVQGTAVLIDGKIAFTPDASYTGVVSFSYTIADSFGLEATANISLEVIPSHFTEANLTVEGVGVAGIVLGSLDNQIFVSGASIDGIIDGGLGSDTITLNVSQDAWDDNYNGIRDKVVNFETINFSDGSTLTFSDVYVNSGVTGINTGDGNDSFIIQSDSTSGINTNGGNDSVIITRDALASIALGSGNNALEVFGDLANTASVTAGDENDTITIGGDVAGTISLNAGNDTVVIGGSVSAVIDGGSGDNNITLNITQAQWDADENGIKSNIVNFNTVTFNDGNSVALAANTDDDDLTATFTDNVYSGAGDDTGDVAINIAWDSDTTHSSVNTEAGNDNISFAGSTQFTDISTGTGDDTVTTTFRHRDVDLGEGDNTLISAWELIGDVRAGSGNDRVAITKGHLGIVDLGDGNNDLTINNSSVSTIALGDGDDVVALNTTSVNTSIDLGDGNNTFTGSAYTNSSSTKVSLIAGYGDDTVTLDSADSVDLGHGNNTAIIGLLHQNLSVGNGDDIINVASIHGNVNYILGNGNNILISSNAESVTGGKDKDIVTLTEFKNIYNPAGIIDLKAGDDKLKISTIVTKDVNMGADNDFVNLKSTSVSGIYSGVVVDGNTGHDAVKLNVSESYYIARQSNYETKLTNFEQIELNDITLITAVLAEDVINGTFAGINASLNDSASKNLTYSLVNINGDAIPIGTFSIDSATGIVSVNDNTLIDYSAASSMIIYVKRVDGDGNEADVIQNFKIEIANNDPVLTLIDADGDTTTINVSQEIATVVGNISDIDGDIDFTSSTFVADHGVVSVDDSTGDISYTSDDTNAIDTVTITINNTSDATINVFTIPILVNFAPVDIIVTSGLSVIQAPIFPNFIGEVNEVDVSVNGSVYGDSTTGWNTLVHSSQKEVAANGVNMSFNISSAGQILGMFGLNANHYTPAEAGVANTYQVIDHAFYFSGTSAQINENGVSKTGFIAGTVDDVYSINIRPVDGQITYLKNGVVLYTSLTHAIPTDEYWFSAATYTPGHGIINLAFSYTPDIMVNQEMGANTNVTSLTADDSDSSTWTYNLVSGDGDTDNASVFIGGAGGDELILVNALIAGKENYTVLVETTDEYGNSYQEIVNFKVNINQAPTDIKFIDSIGVNVDSYDTNLVFIGETSEVDFSDNSTLIGNEVTGWHTLVHTEETVLASDGVNASFKMSVDSGPLETAVTGMFGLNASHYTVAEAGVTDTSESIDYALYFSNGRVKVYENGVAQNDFINGTVDDVYSININKVDGQVTYLKNGIVFYTSTNNATLTNEYWFTAAHYANTTGITNLDFNVASTVFIYENSGANSVVATLSTEDQDSSSWSYSLVSGVGDDDNAAVSIGGTSNNEIILSANPIIATQQKYSVRVQVTDDYGNTYQEIIKFEVKVNLAPTDIITDIISYSLDMLGDILDVNTSTEGSIIKSTGSDGVGSVIYSKLEVLASQGIKMEFQASSAGANVGIWGLDPDKNALSFDYALFLTATQLYIIENSTIKGVFNAHTASDVFAIDVDKDSGEVTYLRNGVVLYTSLTAASLTSEYHMMGSLNEDGEGVKNLSIISLTPHIYENSGTNTSITTLSATDDDSVAWSYSLVSGAGDIDNAAVSIGGASNNELILTANPTIATQQNYSVRVQVTDEFGNTYQEVVTFEVVLNQAPTDIITETISRSLDLLGDAYDVDTSTAGSIIKSTGADGVGSVIYSEEAVLASEGIKMEFQASSAGVNAGIWGLDPDTNTSSFDYAIFLTATQLYIIENSSIMGTYYAHTASDVFAIEVDKYTGEVTYLRNGVVFYTSLTAASLTSEYRMMGNPNADGEGVTNLSITSLSPHIYENSGINSTVTTLSATDDDSTAWTYSLISGVGDDDNAAVSIGGASNNEIILTANPNIATQQSYSVRVQVTDDFGKTYQEVVKFYVVLNQGPQDILTLGIDGVEINTFNSIPNLEGEGIIDVDVSTPGTIVKTAADNNWSNLVTSQEHIIASSGVNVQFQALNNGYSGIWGLDAITAGATSTYNEIDFGFFMPSSTTLNINENGVDIASFGAFLTSDVLSINIDKESGEVTYFKNGVLLYTSLVTANLTAEYAFSGAPRFSGDGIKNVLLSSNTQLTVYDGEGVGQTAVVLGVDDDDSTSWNFALVNGVGDTDNGVVSIGGVGNNELVLSTSPLTATQSSYSVRVQVTDDYGNQYEEIMEFSVVVRTASTPLILDLDGDGVETLSVSQGVLFDIDADGVSEHTGWVNPDDGLLAIDINGDGVINDASELLGEHSINRDGYTARDGFDALANYDLNQDGVINADDEIYTSLLIWQDSNSDGVSQAHELYSLLDLGVESLSLESVMISEDNQGNTAGLRSSWTDTSGNINIVDDIWFTYKDEDSELLLLSDILEEPAMDVLAALTPVAAENNSSLDQQSTLLLEAAYISNSHLDVVVSLELPIDF